MSNSNISSSDKKDMHKLLELTCEPMKLVNELILSMSHAQTELIPQIANYLANAGGKRIRPILTVAIAQLFNTSPSNGFRDENAIKLATAVEFLHTATLLHDDVVDESDLRRGKKAARKIWGNQASVLVGDFLLGQVFRLTVATDSMAALKVMANVACVVAEGEVMQLESAHSLEMNQDEYFKIINAKTAELFTAAAHLGAICAKRGHKDIELVKKYGYNLGIVFQVVDDILDYTGDASSLGKNIGDDFNEGKVTLPVIYCYEACTSEEKKFWREAFAKKDGLGLDQALKLMKKYNSLDKAKEQAIKYSEAAKAAIYDIKGDINKDIKDALIEAVEFCLCRIN